MSPSKSAVSRKSDHPFGGNDRQGRNDALKLARIAHETAQKAAGVWGDMSVGTITREGAAFALIWKGAALTDFFAMTKKRPKEVSKAEHEALCLWLKAGRYDGFKHAITAWNVTQDEAERLKAQLMADLAAQGTKIVNPAE